MENKLLNEQCDSLEQQLVKKQQSRPQDWAVEEAVAEMPARSTPPIEVS